MIRDVHHVGIRVRDLDEARAFYGAALGLPEVPVSLPGLPEALMLGVGRSGLELIPDGDGHQGLDHLCLAAEDIAGLWSRLQAAGVPLRDAAPRLHDGMLSAWLAPEAMDGLLVEVVEGMLPPAGPEPGGFRVLRIDHVVIVAPDLDGARGRFDEHFGVETRRTMERPGTGTHLAFLKPGEVILELARPRSGGEGPVFLSGIAFAVEGLDALVEGLRGAGYPVGDPHPAVQPGARIAALGRDHACGVPVAFLEFSQGQGGA